MKINDLKEAILKRDFDKEYIEDDLEEIDNRVDSFREYFNAVFRHVQKGESLRFQLNAGIIDTDKWQDEMVKLDSDRKLAHDIAINSCEILNRLCDNYHLPHFCVDVEKDADGRVLNRGEVADFVGKFVYNIYQRGINAPALEEIRQQENIVYGDRTNLDASFIIAEKDNRNPDIAYSKDDNIEDIDDYDFDEDGFDLGDD